MCVALGGLRQGCQVRIATERLASFRGALGPQGVGAQEGPVRLGGYCRLGRAGDAARTVIACPDATALAPEHREGERNGDDERARHPRAACRSRTARGAGKRGASSSR
jgi:hypothetical protein